MARKRTQAKRGGAAKRKTAASRSRAKTSTSRTRTKTAAATRSRAKTSTSRSKTKTASRSKTKTASRSKTKTASRSTAKTASRTRAASKKAGTARRAAAPTLRSLEDVLKLELTDLYSAERQLVAALPKVARAAVHPELRAALEQHLEETKGHVRRLEQIFRGQRMSAPSKQSKGMAGLIAEAQTIVAARGDEASKDAALIAAAQKTEHYEIAGYGTARTLADELGLADARGLLDETLAEEGKADELLTRLATGGMFRTGINEQAAP